jgi:hypothetical protein
VFCGDWTEWWFWLSGPWFHALAGCAPLYVVFDVLFYGGPPIELIDCAFCSKDSRVSCGCRVVESGDHPPSKFVVFWDNEFSVMVGSVSGVACEDGGEEGVKGGFIDEHVIREGCFKGGVGLLREVGSSRQGIGLVKDAWFVSDTYVILHDPCHGAFRPWGQLLWFSVVGEIGVVCVDCDVLAENEVAVLVEAAVKGGEFFVVDVVVHLFLGEGFGVKPERSWFSALVTLE